MGIQSFFTGASGLEAHSTWLDVIGNNISNANTVAYKSSRLKFADQLSSSLSQAQGGEETLGGINARQVGNGTRVEAIETLFTQGAPLQTGRNLDLAINGDGFFMVEKENQRVFTRAGNLSLDADGNLVDASGGFVQGIMSKGAGTTSELYDVDKGDPNGLTIDPPQYLSATQATFGPLTESADRIGNIRIQPYMPMPAKDTTHLSLAGNLDAAQRATDAGGILDLAPGGQPVLPLAMAVLNGPIGLTMNGFFDTTTNANGGFSLHQLQRLTGPVVGGGVTLSQAQANSSNAWQQPGLYSPACTATQQVYDQDGNKRQISFLFYQVNDLGDAGVNSADGPSQAAYAWYAFDTTGGAAPSNANLLAGTGIEEGEVAGQNPPGYNRGVWGDEYRGDLLYFNTDGTLTNPGGNSINVQGNPPYRSDIASIPRIYLPALNPSGDGTDVSVINISFGTVGKSDGVTGYAEGTYSGTSYQGVSNVQGISQDGYAAGILKSVSVNSEGVVLGDFSNDQTGVALAQIALARFPNPEGLSKLGDNYYVQSANSGTLEVGFAGQGALGTFQSGALEASNVDLGVELSNMIIAQRSYELNSRTIGVSNENWKTAIDMV